MKKAGRPKGGKNRKWSKEEKLRIVKRYVNEGIGGNAIAAQEGLSKGMMWRWIKAYHNNGEDGLEPKQTSKGNLFAALHTSKSLTETERLKLIIAKQEVEIERLKKGYMVKGDGVNKEYVITNDVNTK